MNKIYEITAEKGIITTKIIFNTELIQMINELYSDLLEAERLTPDNENEAKIRCLCQNILSKSILLRSGGKSGREINNIEKRCYRVLNELERNSILNFSDGKFKPFYKYDISLLVKNAVCACELLLSPSRLTFKTEYSPFYALCSERLITRAVCEEALYFYKNYKSGTVTFSAVQYASRSVLSAEISKDNHRHFTKDEKTFDLLRKIAYIHSGSFVTKETSAGITLYLSIHGNNSGDEQSRRIPSYIDMLRDRTSSVYVIVSSSL